MKLYLYILLYHIYPFLITSESLEDCELGNYCGSIRCSTHGNCNINLIETISEILFSFLINYKTRKILSIFQQIKSNPSINTLLKKLNFNTIISHYTENKNKNLINDTLLTIEEAPKPPYLSPISPKYKYTLVLDLDETLVHYVSDNDSAYIQIRPGAEEFIKELSEFYEIIIFFVKIAVII